VGEEVSAKSGLQRSGSEGVAAKSITDITDPTPAPPRKGRVQEGMAAHKSFLQRVNCYIIAKKIFFLSRKYIKVGNNSHSMLSLWRCGLS
jgi:hypothetical protein